MNEISHQLDDYERKYGLVDRCEFDGDFVVPPELRNRTSNKGSLRIHGGLLTISRSRTFLSLSNNSKSSIHNSTPDLSRSVPNTPGSNHKLSLTSSYDSVLEENEEDGVVVIKKQSGKDKKKGKKSYYSSVQTIFNGGDNGYARRKSEDLLDARNSSNTSNGNLSMRAVEQQQQHVRQSSDSAYKLIPRVKNPINLNEGIANRSTVNANIPETSKLSASTSLSSVSLNNHTIIHQNHPPAISPTRWGHNRHGSSSFQSDLNISSISTYTIPRVTLSHQKVTMNDTNQRALPRKSLPENRVSSTFLTRHDNNDSAA